MRLTLYIDGDAFPNPLKPILLRAIEREIAADKLSYILGTQIKILIIEGI